MNNKILNWLVVIVIVNYACYAYRSKHLTCCTDIHQYRLLINFCFPIYQRTYPTLSLNICKVYGLEPFAAPLFATPFINFRRTFCYFFNPLIFNRDAKVDNHFQTAKSFLKIFFHSPFLPIIILRTYSLFLTSFLFSFFSLTVNRSAKVESFFHSAKSF